MHQDIEKENESVLDFTLDIKITSLINKVLRNNFGLKINFRDFLIYNSWAKVDFEEKFDKSHFSGCEIFYFNDNSKNFGDDIMVKMQGTFFLPLKIYIQI